MTAWYERYEVAPRGQSSGDVGLRLRGIGPDPVGGNGIGPRWQSGRSWVQLPWAMAWTAADPGQGPGEAAAGLGLEQVLTSSGLHGDEGVAGRSQMRAAAWCRGQKWGRACGRVFKALAWAHNSRGLGAEPSMRNGG